MNNRIKLLLEYLVDDPTDTFSNYALAIEYQGLQHYDKAIEQLENLKQSTPNYLATYYTLGKLYEEVSNTNNAIINYKIGALLAKKLNDKKTLGEFNEALLVLDALDE